MENGTLCEHLDVVTCLRSGLPLQDIKSWPKEQDTGYKWLKLTFSEGWLYLLHYCCCPTTLLLFLFIEINWMRLFGRLIRISRHVLPGLIGADPELTVGIICSDLWMACDPPEWIGGVNRERNEFPSLTCSTWETVCGEKKVDCTKAFSLFTYSSKTCSCLTSDGFT